MTVYRVDVLVQDPEDVFAWNRENVPEGQVIRQVGYKLRDAWLVKVVFKQQSDAERFHTVWIPQASSHTVLPWGKRKTV